MQILKYDASKWQEILPRPVNTLQVFVTNKCNKRCKACFYAHNLGEQEIKFEDYKKIAFKYADSVAKVILLGGEPTLYKNINKIIKLNNLLNLKTTVYTNGANIRILEDAEDLSQTTIRIGVLGAYKSEKPLAKVQKTNLPVTIVYMLRKDNVNELMKTVEMAEKRFNCKKFYISSIRDIAATKNYWKDTDETLTLQEYADTVQDFLENYKGNMEMHISKRGILETNKKYPFIMNKCRFGNVFPDKKKIICPFDISQKIYTKELSFRARKCNKHKECLLQKIVLKRKII
ncbi:MAG: radical SAM protein [Nanoarchaeota archaeon]|nr:radical SAM protein [Nanoarchaeota archaeon]MBU1321514.1 radical SAM protein [Nanoarchaeota archaeon]MBU1597131.1 radical SAM protein [Nanoarchaeota archaeon]MBU2441535.1 radical SAM protein [Nanoarchaeota archaeon]